MSGLLSGNAPIALGSAAAWGGGDFSGGMGVKTAGGSTGAALRVVALSHMTSLSVLALILFLRHGSLPAFSSIVWGLGAGVVAGLSLTAFYVALSRGGMGISAAISGLLAAAIPAAVAMVLEGSPGALRLAGFVVAGVAIWMIAAEAGSPAASGTMALAISAGAGFGVYFVALRMAGTAGPVETMALARVGSLSTCTLLILLGKLKRTPEKTAEEPVRITLRTVRWILLTALLDTSGNLLFVAATERGRLDVAAVLASLYPAGTIALAAWTLGERPTRRQGVGMLVALAAVVMITI